MKYFVKKHPRGDHLIFSRRLAEEIIRDRALACYKSRKVGGFGALLTIQLFIRGTTYNQGDFTIWGEEVTEKECFKRRLAGKLSPNILQ